MSAQQNCFDMSTVKIQVHELEIAALRETVSRQHETIAELLIAIRFIRSQQQNLLDQQMKLAERTDASRGAIFDINRRMTHLTLFGNQLSDHEWALYLLNNRMASAARSVVEEDHKNNAVPIAENRFDFVIPACQLEAGTIAFQI